MTVEDCYVRLEIDDLYEFVCEVLQKLQTPKEISIEVARVLIEADAAGYTSHGSGLLVSYAEQISNLELFPSKVPVLKHITKNTLKLDGRKGWGHHAMLIASREAENVAKEEGICLVSTTNLGHIGRLGTYVEQLANSGYISMLTSASGFVVAEALCTATGMASRQLGSNPIAIGMPVKGEVPFVLDTSTSSISYFKLMEYCDRGESLPQDMLLDRKGNVTNDPNAFLAGGCILPSGGYKGRSASLAVSLLACLCEQPFEPPGVIGTILIVLNPSAIGSDKFGNRAANFLRRIAAESGGSDIIPGWRMSKRVKASQLSGLRIPIKTYERLQELGKSIDVHFKKNDQRMTDEL